MPLRQQKSSFKVVLTDLSMPDMSGMEVLAHFAETFS